jgi:hypothetical protein
MITGEQCARALEDLDFHGLDTVLPAQPHQLGTLVTGQTLFRALVDIGLTHPIAQARIRNPQIAGYLGDRFAAEPYQLDSTPAKLRWMCNRHEDSLPENGADRLRIGVRTTGSGSHLAFGSVEPIRFAELYSALVTKILVALSLSLA